MAINSRSRNKEPMAIPPSVRVRRRKIEILWSDNLDTPDSDMITDGEWRPDEYQIILKTGMSEADTWKTLLHELCHVYNDLDGHGLNHTSIRKFEKIMWDIIKTLGFYKQTRKKKEKK